jgi:hypothetical protein
MNIISFEYSHTIGSLLVCIFLLLTVKVFIKCFNFFKRIKSLKYFKTLKKENNVGYDHYDPFVISFRKTRTEMIIISKIEELQKTRDIQFVVSFLNYKDNKSVKGSIYIVTSKIVYKIVFIKYNSVMTIFHNLNTFVGFNNNSYKLISDYLITNKNCEKQKHHNEFFTWSHYFFNNNYDKELSLWEEFIKFL